MPKPFGHEFVESTVGENIAMNFASGAQQPFLEILDEIKKIYLATDGLGNQVLIKGFSSEGHDSANTDYAGHWNERAGGLKDFTVLLEHAREYNARVGIHINASRGLSRSPPLPAGDPPPRRQRQSSKAAGSGSTTPT